MEQGTVGLTPDPSLQPGTYDGSVTISSAGFSDSPLTVPVHYVVLPPATSYLTPIPSQLVILGNYDGTAAVNLPSYEYGKLTITSVTPWIVPTPDGSAASIIENSLPAGVSVGQITIARQFDPQSPYQVTVFAVEGTTVEAVGVSNVLAGPAILSFLAQPADTPKHATVGVWPSGAYRVPFTATSEATWLTVSPAAGSAPWILSLTANPGGLQPGTYASHLDIAANHTGNGGARIPVTLTIQENVPFNIDPAAVAVRPAEGQIQIVLTLNSAQTMTYTADTGDFNIGLEAVLSCTDDSGLSGTTPGQIAIQLGACAGPGTGWGDLNFTTSDNNVREVPVAVMPTTLFPLINPGGIVNDATFSPGPVAPGSIVAIFGLDLAYSVSSYSAPLPDFSPLPTPDVGLFPNPNQGEIGIFYQSPTQWNIQIPYELTPGNYLLHIGNYTQVAFSVAAVAPYVFNWGANHGSILNADNSLNTPDTPAAAGSFMQVYLTGQGAVSPPVNSRMAAPATPLSYVVANTTATIDGASAQVSFAGLAPGFVGLCQVNIDIPTGLPAGQHKLVITIGGMSSNDVVFDTK